MFNFILIFATLVSAEDLSVRPSTWSPNFEHAKLHTAKQSQDYILKAGTFLFYNKNAMPGYKDVNPNINKSDSLSQSLFISYDGVTDWSFGLQTFQSIYRNSPENYALKYGDTGMERMNLVAHYYFYKSKRLFFSTIFQPTFNFVANNFYVGKRTDLFYSQGLSASYLIGRYRFTSNLFYLFNPNESYNNSPIKPIKQAVEPMLGFSYSLNEKSELTLESSLFLPLNYDRNSTKGGVQEWSTTYNYKAKNQLKLYGGLTIGGNNNDLSPDYRILAGLKMQFFKKTQPAITAADSLAKTTLARKITRDKNTLRVSLPKLFFDTNKHKIKEKFLKQLDEFILTLYGLDKLKKIEIHSHTDSRGSADYNKRLSKKRGLSLAYFMKKKGLGKDFLKKIQVLYHGEEKPVASNDNSHGRQKNRRVEMVLRFKGDDK